MLLQGLCASKGVAIGRLYVVDRAQLEVTEYHIPKARVEQEVERLYAALEQARAQLREVRARIPQTTTADITSFIDTHLLMLQDSALTRVPEAIIRERQVNAEWAMKLQRDELVAVFEAMDDAYLRTRRDDVDHVVSRIQRILLRLDHKHDDHLGNLFAGQVVLAHDLTPADVVLLHHQGIAGFITEYGGPTSHAAILARSLRMPSLVGMHQARTYLRDDDLVILDGRAGVLITDPDERAVAYYRGLQERIEAHHAARHQLRDRPTRTRDGRKVTLHANIELPDDVVAVRRVGAEGVGLYRTEFLFMNRERMPDEEEQVAAYSAVVLALEGAPVTIRTLDVGADKTLQPAAGTSGPVCSNPALGLRAVRLCLREPALFLTQLRAILRAAVHGQVRLMIPMLSSLHEVFQVRQMVDTARRSLRRDGLPCAEEVPIGAMVEVPATALCADLFAPHLDFLSIGTNDLIQYAIAIDRVDDEVNYLYDPLHPAVLRLVAATIRAGQGAGIPVSMCGEMAGNSSYTRLLLGMGLREFSVPPNALLEIKQVINESDTAALGPLAERFLEFPDPLAVGAMLADINRAG